MFAAYILTLALAVVQSRSHWRYIRVLLLLIFLCYSYCTYTDRQQPHGIASSSTAWYWSFHCSSSRSGLGFQFWDSSSGLTLTKPTLSLVSIAMLGVDGQRMYSVSLKNSLHYQRNLVGFKMCHYWSNMPLYRVRESRPCCMPQLHYFHRWNSWSLCCTGCSTIPWWYAEFTFSHCNA